MVSVTGPLHILFAAKVQNVRGADFFFTTPVPVVSHQRSSGWSKTLPNSLKLHISLMVKQTSSSGEHSSAYRVRI